MLRGLLGTQSSGLLVVILVLGAVLALLGGEKDKRQAIDLSPGDTWRSELVDREAGRYRVVVEVDGRERVFVDSSRPRERIADGSDAGNPGVRTVFVTQRVNRFLDSENLVLVAKDASFIAIMAVGMTGVIILAGIDLSVGAVYGLSAVIGAMALRALGPGAGLGPSLLAGLGVTCCVGAACGFVNGLLTVGFRVHSFVITLGTLAVFRGLIFVVSGGQSVGGFPESYTSGLIKAEVSGTYPVPVVFMVVVGVVGWAWLSRTVMGRQAYAVGGNETAARYAGVPVGRVKIVLFTLAGLLAGLSAAVYLGYLGAAEPNAGTGYELRVIAAAVIGGASLMGGRGSALGAVLGAVIIELIGNAMIILGIDQSYNQIVMGSAIIVAVVIDRLKHHFVSRG